MGTDRQLLSLRATFNDVRGMRPMVSSRHLKPIRVMVVLILFLVTFMSAATVTADCEEDLAALQAELDATEEELAKVKKERDDYAQRLEDSTTIMIIALILLVGSYFFFYLNTRRAKIAFLEYQKRTGIKPGESEPRPRRRRRG
jgi:short subunit fatty acids transporter